MKLVPLTCVACRRPCGYVTPEAFQIPTLCIVCVADSEVMEEWEHTVPRNDLAAVIAVLRSKLARINLEKL